MPTCTWDGRVSTEKSRADFWIYRDFNPSVGLTGFEPAIPLLLDSAGRSWNRLSDEAETDVGRNAQSVGATRYRS